MIVMKLPTGTKVIYTKTLDGYSWQVTRRGALLDTGSVAGTKRDARSKALSQLEQMGVVTDE